MSSSSLFILISAPAKEKRFAVYYKYEEDRVEDGDFYFDLEMSAFYSIVKITVEKYDWNASHYVSSYNVIVRGIVDTTDTEFYHCDFTDFPLFFLHNKLHLSSVSQIQGCILWKL